ncbi:MAG: rubrerythrin [Firmicutes bacterium]|nr:rubrerythrin [Bacillota bacterium]
MTIDELQILRQAILNEQEGYDFYSLAAAQTDLEEAREAFGQLAAEELKHIEWLRDLYGKIKANDPESFDLSKVEQPPAPGLYDWQNIGRESGSLAVSVFGIGINMEKAAIDFYSRAAEKTQLPAARELYKILIRWENQHLEQFQQDYDTLREEWWEKQGFTPS